MLGIELLRTPYLIAQLTLHLCLAGMALPGLPGRPQGCARAIYGQPSATSTYIVRAHPCGRPGPLLGNALTDFCRDEGRPGPLLQLGNALTDFYRDESRPGPLVILGNPPYAGHSANKDSSITSLLDTYKEGCPELKKPAQAKWLSDDYLNFLRYAQWQIDQAGQAILACRTNP